MFILKNHKKEIFISVLLAVTGVAFSILPYYETGRILILLSSGSTCLGDYLQSLAFIFAGFLGQLFFHELSTVTSHNLAYGIIEDQRKKLAAKLSRLSMGQIEAKSSGRWSQFMVETLDKLEKPIAHMIPEVLANLLIPVVLCIVIFTMDWRIGLANLLTLPLGLLFSLLMMSGYEEKSKRYISASKQMNTTVVEYVRGIKVIKAFNKSASSYQKFKDAVEGNRDAMLNWYLSICFAMTAAMETLPSTLIFVLPCSLFLYSRGSLEPSVMLMCILVAYASYRPLIRAMAHMDTMANVRVIFEEIQDVMELPEPERGCIKPSLSTFDVEFKDVSFSYDRKTEVLKNVSFHAKAHELTAIVGYSGCGKSTIAKLIAGFWDAEQGKVCIGGQNVRDISAEEHMKLVTYVSQENFLFRQSILDNMRMAKESASQEEIENACKRASCHDFISALPQGFHTMVGEEGADLSGGERQRLTIARALLKDSPVILLDEATAYSDPDNEAVIQESIEALVKDKTVIMIAHRLPTIIRADHIIVMENGRIEAEGRHAELLQKSRIYQQLWQACEQSRQLEVI